MTGMGAIAWGVWIGEQLVFSLAILASVLEGSPLPLALLGGGLLAIRVSALGFGLAAGRSRGQGLPMAVFLSLTLGILYWGRRPKPGLAPRAKRGL
jgi:hypothetical protein